VDVDPAELARFADIAAKLSEGSISGMSGNARRP